MRAIERLAVVLGFTLLPAFATAQPLPRVDGPLTIERAVDLAMAKSLRVKAAGAKGWFASRSHGT
jgi:hypothetical protein